MDLLQINYHASKVAFNHGQHVGPRVRCFTKSDLLAITVYPMIMYDKWSKDAENAFEK